MSHPVRTTPVFHSMDCDCASCAPTGPAGSAVEEAGNHIVAATVVGFLLGWLVVFLFDRMTGGPGMLVGFGL